MFHTPAFLDDNVQQFLRLAEAKKILADLNKILHLTAFNPRVSNPCFPLAVLTSLGTCGILVWHSRGNPFLWYLGGLLAGLILPYLVFFILVTVAKSWRTRQLTNYVAEWNR